MNSPSRDSLYLEHIAERIRRIEEAVQEGREAFESSHIVQDAVIRKFEVMGEAVKQRSPELRNQYPEVPWRRIAGFRDVLIHNYRRSLERYREGSAAPQAGRGGDSE
jgi:uncharacterized protein with HEPN domain